MSRRSFQHDSSGATAVIFGLSIFPLSIFAAAALDYSFALRAKTNLQADLDASVLSAASFAASQVNANSTPTSTAINARIQREMTARVAGYKPPAPVTTTATFGYAANTITIAATASASVNPFFRNMLGVSSYTINVNSTAAQNTVNYANISLVVDVSPSMAVAASPGDIATLQTLTQAQTGTACAFACHDSDSAGPSNYSIARAGGVQLRIDVVKSAAQQLLNFMSTSQQATGQYSAALYSIAATLKTIVAPTTALGSVTSAVGSLDFDAMSSVAGTLPYPASLNISMGDSLTHYSDSDFATSLGALNGVVAANGAGLLPSSRAQYVFIITDGLDDEAVPYNASISATYNYPTIPNFSAGNNAGKITKPLDPATCSALKSRGVQVGVLYVTYWANPTDPLGVYQWLVQTNAPPSQLVTNLTNCASPGFFYQADDAAGISTGLMTLFRSVMLTSRLTH
jgi:Flp pilus assembly protein TadG